MSWETFTRTKEFSEALKSVNARPLRFVTHGDEKEWKLNTVTGEFTSPIALDGRIVSMKDLGIDRPFYYHMRWRLGLIRAHFLVKRNQLVIILHSVNASSQEMVGTYMLVTSLQQIINF